MRWQKHLGLLIKFINDNNMEIIAEVGVEKGGQTRYLLKLCPDIKEYWAIDQWIVVSDLVHGKNALERNKLDWFNLYQKVCQLMIHFKQLRVLRMTSLEASKVFPDKYFDFVYIDAEHSYDAVVNDIAAWLPKVKIGGYLGGHDYNLKSVKKAVWHQFGDPSVDDRYGLLDRYVWLKYRLR